MNIYGFELKGGRIDHLAIRFDKIADRFIKEIKKFLTFLNIELEKIDIE